ncbi:MAG: N-acetyltransferase [Arcanobacterium sp.]|nr:N-acetyltransferase [Arcanobacterium sp.]MDY5589081.1 GNAT family N-acetyltransferase [Arcanobacterium sp.]
MADMSESAIEYAIIHNELAGQWEARLKEPATENGLGSVIGYIAYDILDDTFMLTHTTVKEQYRGKGIAEELVRTALDEIAAARKTVIPLCSYAQAYIEKNPRYASLVAAEN